MYDFVYHLLLRRRRRLRNSHRHHPQCPHQHQHHPLLRSRTGLLFHQSCFVELN